MRKGQFKMRGRCGLVFFGVLLALGFLVTYYIWSQTWLSGAPSRKSVSNHRNLGGKYVTSIRRPGVHSPRRGQQPPLGDQQLPQRSQPLAAPRRFHTKDTQLAVPPQPASLPGFGRVNGIVHASEADYLEETSREGQDRDGKQEGKQGQGKAQESRGNSLYMEPDDDLVTKFNQRPLLVHLDLKGALPSLAYLKKVFPIFKQAGATGLLVEYEDSFPYSGNLSLLAAENAYTTDQIEKLVQLAEQNELEIIPLVPTFGHMEFVLKHPEFAGLRESPYTPQVISPANEATYTLIGTIISQVMSAHPKTKYIHIGHDEVYELGKGKSDSLMTRTKMSKDDLFMFHAKKVVDLVNFRFPHLKVLMWDDHFRKMPLEQMQRAQLAGKVELMVWNYETDVNVRVPPTVWKKYGRAFPNVWVASAFKGATGVNQYITNASYHLQNHYSWIRTIREHQGEVNIRGMAITGWSRYDYFSTPAELLPAALPSLTACLLAARNGGFTREHHSLASKILTCSKNVELDMPRVVNGTAVVTQDCSFPGSPIFYGTQQLWGIVSNYESDRGMQERIKGWLTDYHIRHGFSSPGQLKVLNKKLSQAIDKLVNLRGPMKSSLEKFYDRNTVEEWLEFNIDQRVSGLRATLNKSMTLASHTTWGKRPGGEGGDSHPATPGGSTQAKVPGSRGMAGSQGQDQPHPGVGPDPGRWQSAQRMRGSPYARPQPQTRGNLPLGGSPNVESSDPSRRNHNQLGVGGRLPPLGALSRKRLPEAGGDRRQGTLSRQGYPGGGAGQPAEQGGRAGTARQIRPPLASGDADGDKSERENGERRRAELEGRAGLGGRAGLEGKGGGTGSQANQSRMGGSLPGRGPKPRMARENPPGKGKDLNDVEF